MINKNINSRISEENMACIASYLTEEQTERFYEAILQHQNQHIININEMIGIPPPALILTPSINESSEQNALELLNNSILDIIETPATLSHMSIWRNDRHFYIRHNNRVFHISTDENLNVYDVKLVR